MLAEMKPNEVENLSTENRKIRVLHLRSCRGGGGGPEKTILNSVLEADPDEFELHVAYLKSWNDMEFDLTERAEKMGVDRFVAIEEHRKLDVRALRKLLCLLKEKDIHILHCHCYKSDLYGLILKRWHPMKVLTTAHGPLASFQYFWASQNWRVRYLYDQLDLRILRFFDRVVMVSDSMRGIISRYGVAPKRLIWVKNAIDARHFRRKQAGTCQVFRQQIGVPIDAMVVGAVGRLNGEKDYPNLLHAAELLLRDRKNLYFLIAGKGALETSLRALAAKLQISDRVLFLGHFHDVRKVYESMDVYALSSTREGLPNTVLEAMAMQVPIVATDVDGVSEAVTHGHEALLVPPQDPKRLAESIGKLLDDAKLRQQLAEKGRIRVEQEFSFARRMRHVESIYRDLLAETPTQA
jgi:glycosyltransferase involved in cell wall biosynthesis